jgi:hypothetical protein
MVTDAVEGASPGIRHQSVGFVFGKVKPPNQMADLRVFILKGNVRLEANWVKDLGYLDEGPTFRRQNVSPARRSVLHQSMG